MGYHLYTDLDTIFDTRYQLLKVINPKELKRIVLDGSYHSRITENYGNISYEMFKPIWDKRIKQVLVYAPRTGMLDIIKDQFLQCIVDPVYTDVLKDLTLYVNTYPYNLTEEESKDIEDGIARTIIDLNIECMYKPWSELTTNWMVENIGYIFMYEFINWVNYQITTGTFNVKLNRIEAYAPGVLRLESPIKITNKAVLELEENYKMLCNLSLIDAEYFSAKMIKIGKKKVEEAKK